MTYDPVFSSIAIALIAVGIAEFAVLIRNWRRNTSFRKSHLEILETELNSNIELFSRMKTELGEHVSPSINQLPFYNFLNSGVVDPNKDKQLLKFIYSHLHNIAKIDRALNKIDNYTVNEKTELKTQLEESVKCSIDEINKNIDNCIAEVLKLKYQI